MATAHGDGEMVKLDVRVPETLLEAIDETYAERGYANRSEAVRDALRDWVGPPITLSPETLAALEMSREQRARGETRSLDEVADSYGVDLVE